MIRSCSIALWCGVTLYLHSAAGAQQPAGAMAQPASPPPSVANHQPGNTSTGSPTAQQSSWLVRDPATGRIFQQQLVSVSVPRSSWEVRPVQTTVYQPQRVVQTVPSNQTIYTPTTQYVMQPKLRGWWNPWRPPVQAYEYVPITSWQPQTQSVTSQVASIQWVPTQQTVYVPQLVHKLETQQQLVSKEIPQPSAASIARNPVGPGISGLANATNLFGLGLRPIAAPAYPSTAYPTQSYPTSLYPAANYPAPLRTASAATGSTERDPNQIGMAPTILR